MICVDAKTNRNYNDTSQISLALERENEALRGTVADYKRAFEFLMKKHKELKVRLFKENANINISCRELLISLQRERTK